MVFAPEGRTDAANAARFVGLNGDRARYVGAWGKWIVWTGRRWEVDDCRRHLKLARRVAEWVWGEATDLMNDKEVRAFAAASSDLRRLEAMAKIAAADLAVPLAALNADPWLLNAATGTVDLRTGRLRPHDPADFITVETPVAFAEGAAAPRWERFLREIFEGDDDLIGFVRRLAGYALAGVVHEHVMPVFWGGGANGKSVFIEALAHALGPYAMKAPPDLLLAKAGNAHPTERAALYGKRFVAAVETGDGRKLNEALVKELTGGDTITARRMREDYWSFAPTFTVVLATNHKPAVSGRDNGIWRRLRCVPFARTFAPDEQDRTLPETLRSEAPGILAWAVRGCLEWQRDGLGTCAAVDAATATYRTEEDVIGRFVAECCVTEPGVRVKVGTFRDALCAYCGETGDKPPAKNGVRSALEDAGFGWERTNSARWYTGVGLLADG